MGRKITILLLVFCLGLGVLLYPLINSQYTAQRMEASVGSFLATTEPDSVPEETAVEEPTMPYAALWDAMVSYNEQLYETRQSELTSAEAITEPAFLLSGFGADGDTFAVLSIPKINLSMPLYLGATDQHMAMGAAQLGQTSLPIGGSNTNCVIAGHRGYSGADYFRYVPDLAIGDSVYIRNVWESLRYRVVEKKIIDPDDIPAIEIQPGRDLVTLLTCHPYASGGRQRYLVICERTEE